MNRTSRRNRFVCAAIASTLGMLASGASAQNWDELVDGGADAPQLPPGQITVGTGALGSISGTISDAASDVDMYCIFIPDEKVFTASVFENIDGLSAQLWIFDTSGNGIAHGCDNTSPYTTGIAPGLVPSPGIYFIAISRLGLVPVDGAGTPIFPTITSGQIGPDPLAGPIFGWSGPGQGQPGPYRIVFENAEYHQGPGGGDDGTQPPGGPCWTYTSFDHFNYGNLFNIELTVDTTGDECIRLSDSIKAWPFVAIANSSRGTLTRIAVQDIPALGIAEGDVVGEYLTAPSGMGRNPSRTTVDGYGNVWVGNRNEGGSSGGQLKGSMTRVGLVLGGTRVDAGGVPNPTGQYLQGPFEYCGCEDRDGDGLIKTSIGYPHTTGALNVDYVNTVLPWTNTAGADSNGGVTTADDECVTAYYRTEGTGVRHVSIDANNDVWVGGRSNREFELVDGSLATQITAFQSTCGGYGGLVDPDGILWSAQWGSNNLMRYDPVSTLIQCLTIPNYGVGIDAECTTASEFSIWTSVANDGFARETSPAGVLLNTYSHGSSSIPRGLVVKDGDVWVAHSGTNNVGRLSTSGAFLGNVIMFESTFGVSGSRPHGVAVDTNGKIWAPNFSTNNAMRIDPNLGAFGEVDLAVDLGSGSFPYNYSDMTGDLYLSIAPQGSWTFVHDAGVAGCEWGTLSWLEQITGSASVTVRVRASDSPIPSGAWTDISNNVPFTGVTGQYLQVQVTLNRDIVDCLPDGEALLCELTICKAADCTIEIDEVLCDPANPGTLIVTGTVFNDSGIDASTIVLTPMPVGSGITFTPNIIAVNLPTGSSITFTTTVTGWTEGEEFCFLITLLDDTMEVCCTAEVCITPDCSCLQVPLSTVSIECDPFTGDYFVSFSIDNLTGQTIYHAYLFAPSGTTITPNYFAFPLGIPNGSSTGPLNVVISGANAGEFCFNITLHDELLNECCGREVCIDLPVCQVGQGGGDDPDGTGGPALAGPPWVHLDVGVAAASGPIADAVLTIINNSDEQRIFEWRVGTGDFPGCNFILPDGSITPSSGTTLVLDPRKCVDIPLQIDVSMVPDGDIACLKAVVVHQPSGLAISTGGQVIGVKLLEEVQPPIRLWAVPSVTGQVVGITPGVPERLSFFISSDQADGGSFEYSIQSTNPFVSLDGLPPGEMVIGTVDVAQGAITEVVVLADLVGPSETWILDIVFSARPGGGYPVGHEALTAIAVRDSTFERCSGDFNGDGVIDFFDVSAFLIAYNSQDPAADLNGDGVYDFFDVSQFLVNFSAGCS